MFTATHFYSTKATQALRQTLIGALLSLALLYTHQVLAQRSQQGVDLEPEQVILVHGFGRSSSSMWLLERRLRQAGYQVSTLDYRSFFISPNQEMESLHQRMLASIERGGKVHFVGHSLGGLMIRSFLERYEFEAELGQVVMLGTPNQGSLLAERYSQTWLAQKVPGMHQLLGTNELALAGQLKGPDYSAGVIAGVKQLSLVTVLVKGENDGLVAVESTHLPELTDFITLSVGHAMMRYDIEVARQTIHFLQHGRFNKKGTES